MPDRDDRDDGVGRLLTTERRLRAVRAAQSQLLPAATLLSAFPVAWSLRLASRLPLPLVQCGVMLFFYLTLWTLAFASSERLLEWRRRRLLAQLRFTSCSSAPGCRPW